MYFNVVDLFCLAGVGWTIVTVSYLVSFYYNTVIAWSIYYFFSSFTANLPWTSCNNEWNTCDCWTGDAITNYSVYESEDNVAIKNGCYNQTLNSIEFNTSVGPTTEFFE